MRIVFYCSHLLHARSLIPVCIELVHRGHAITVQTSRPNWMGMPTFQMNWRPTNVTGVNKTSLTWLANRIGFGQEWQAVQSRVDYKPHFIPEEYDAAVSTTKDMDFLRDMGKEINGYMTTYAVGYQHFPGIIQGGRYEWVDRLLQEELPPPMSTAFTGTHPFGASHGFRKLAGFGRVTPCGFPHLDKVLGTAFQAGKVPRPTVLIQHPGGHRGIHGHRWLAHLARDIIDAGYDAAICPHLLPGYGYDAELLHYAMKAQGPYNTGWWFTEHWWDVAGDCDLILTTGSSAAYEMWAVGLTNVFILGYIGGKRHEKFQMFSDLLVESPEALGRLLQRLPESAHATNPLTQEVMAAYRNVHDGQGAKTAADVVEGKP